MRRMRAYIGLSIKIYAPIATIQSVNDIWSDLVIFLSPCLRANSMIMKAVEKPAKVPQAPGPAPSPYCIRNDITHSTKNIIQLNTWGVVFPFHVSTIYFP